MVHLKGVSILVGSCLTNNRLDWKILTGTKTLAYYNHLKIMTAKSCITYRPVVNIIKFVFFVTGGGSNKLECFPIKSVFQASPMFGSKAMVLHSDWL
jgi:hypothetical protein